MKSLRRANEVIRPNMNDYLEVQIKLSRETGLSYATAGEWVNYFIGWGLQHEEIIRMCEACIKYMIHPHDILSVMKGYGMLNGEFRIKETPSGRL